MVMMLVKIQSSFVDPTPFNAQNSPNSLPKFASRTSLKQQSHTPPYHPSTAQKQQQNETHSWKMHFQMHCQHHSSTPH